MSRMAISGTRTSSRTRWPSGFSSACTVTSFGISWARSALAKTRATNTNKLATTEDTEEGLLGGEFVRLNTLRKLYTGACTQRLFRIEGGSGEAECSHRNWPAHAARRARHRPDRAPASGDRADQRQDDGAALRG